MTGKRYELADMLQRRRIDICCVQETRWAGRDAYPLAHGYKLYYSGITTRSAGVGVVLSEALSRRVMAVDRPSDRVIRVKLDLQCGTVSVISAYCPQKRHLATEKDAFYDLLETTVRKSEPGEHVFVLGDFNGHIGQRVEGEERHIGRHCIGSRNHEGTRAVEFAKGNDLAIVNSFFQKREGQLITYRSANSQSQVDFIMCSRDTLKQVRDCKVLPGESVAPQHKPVVCRLVMRAPNGRDRKGPKRIQWFRLKEDNYRAAFVRSVTNKLGGEYPVEWGTVAGAIRTAAREALGVSSGRCKAGKETWWWTPEVQAAIKAKQVAKKRWDARLARDRQELRDANRAAKRTIAEAKRAAYASLYANLSTSDSGTHKSVYRLATQRHRARRDVQHVRRMRLPAVGPAQQGAVAASDTESLERWAQYFTGLSAHPGGDGPANRQVHPSSPMPNPCPASPGSSTGADLGGSVATIGSSEVRRALKKSKKGKATGPDEIPTEVWSCLGEPGIRFLTVLFGRILEGAPMPDEWRRSTTVPIFKGRGDVQNCDNYRGIRLMSQTMKLYERVLECRLRKLATDIGDQQFGFMPGRSTTDAIFAVRRVCEKYLEQGQQLHCVFIDLKKAFDSVPREVLWDSLRRKTVPEPYIRAIQDMYQGSESVVRTAVGETDPFPITLGLHQGSALSPFLFNLVIDEATKGVRREVPWNILFADDVGLLSETREGAEGELKKWCDALERAGLTVSRTKTEYMCASYEDTGDSISLDGTPIPTASEFKYLGSIITADGTLGSEVAARAAAGWRSFRRVSPVLCDARIPVGLKGKVYRACVRPAIMYGLETTGMTSRPLRKLQTTEAGILRMSLGLSRRECEANCNVRRRLGVKELGEKLREDRLRWYGHVQRRDCDYIGKRALDLAVKGKRKPGRPRYTWLDVLQTDMEKRGLKPPDAQFRTAWRQAIKTGYPAPAGIICR